MNARRMEFANRKNKKRIVDIINECENKIVFIYGPYPPAEGRTKWRVVIYDPSTGRRKIVCEETRGAADLLAVQLRRETETETKPVLTVYEALAQWIDEKRAAWRHPDSVARNVENRFNAWISDVPVDEIDAARASALYLVRLDHILETPRMGVDGETGLQHKGQRPIQRTRSAWRRRQTCARVQCSVSVICALASVRFRPDRLFCMRRLFLPESGVAARCSSPVSVATAPC